MGSPNERVPNSTETVGKVGEWKCVVNNVKSISMLITACSFL